MITVSGQRFVGASQSWRNAKETFRACESRDQTKRQTIFCLRSQAENGLATANTKKA
jgi:hypothetical protein